MDSKTLEQLGAKVTKGSVSLSRKVGDGDYGSAGVNFSVEFDIATGADADAAIGAAYEYIKAMHKENAAGDLKAIQSHNSKPSPTPAPSPPPAATGEPERVPVANDGTEYDIFEVDTLEVQFSPNGTKYAKAKGGKWSKWGVTVWPEVLITAPLEWDLDALEAQEYQAPEGLTAKAIMKDGSPKKVVEWV